jgi:hypothetical protein
MHHLTCTESAVATFESAGSIVFFIPVEIHSKKVYFSLHFLARGDGGLVQFGDMAGGDYIRVVVDQGFLRFDVSLGAGAASARTRYVFADQHWHFLSVSLDGGVLLVYVDQLLELSLFTAPGAIVFDLRSDMTLGQVQGVSFDGSIRGFVFGGFEVTELANENSTFTLTRFDCRSFSVLIT